MEQETERAEELSPDVNARKYQPLALPMGSVRALLVLLLSCVVFASFAFDWIILPDGVLELWFGAIGYYVGYRTTNNRIAEMTT